MKSINHSVVRSHSLMNLMDSWVCLFFTTRAVSGESDWSCTVASHGYTLCRTAAQQAYRGWQDWYQHLRCCGLVMEQQTGDTCHEAVRVEMAPSPKYLEVTHHLRSRVKWQYRGTAQAEPQWTVKHFQPSTELYITSVCFFFFLMRYKQNEGRKYTSHLTSVQQLM